MPSRQIEHEAIIFLEANGIPAKLVDCRRLHPCSGCRGEGCWRCNRTGVGPITGLVLTYCESCGRTNRDFDPRLRLLPGDTPRPDPKPPVHVPDDLIGKHGALRTMTALEHRKEKTQIRRESRADRKRQAAKAKAAAKAGKLRAGKAAEKAFAKEEAKPKPHYIAVRRLRTKDSTS